MFTPDQLSSLFLCGWWYQPDHLGTIDPVMVSVLYLVYIVHHKYSTLDSINI